MNAESQYTHVLAVYFYDPEGKLIDAMKDDINPDVLIDRLIRMADDHNLVHIEQRGAIVEICATVKGITNGQD